MPLYEYECTKCKHHFELLQKFSDKPAKVCPRCGAPAQRLISSPAIQFKGTGWYVTDYGKSGGSTETKDSKPANDTDTAKEKVPADKAAAPAASESSKSKESNSPSTANPKP